MVNYRTISVTPIFAKFFRGFFFSNWLITLKNNLLNKEQFVFQNKKFSKDAVLFFTERVLKNHENGKNSAAIIFNLEKAFNSIFCTKIFLKKADCFNFSEPAVNLLISVLTQTSQCVKIGTEISEHIFVNHGVPQGTVLGTLIFLSLLNLQTTLVFYVKMNQEEQLQQKFEIFYSGRTVTWRKINSLWRLIKQNCFIFLPETN